MTGVAILLAALAAYYSKSGTFKVGVGHGVYKTVTVTVNGQPHHLTFGEALQAVTAVLSCATGTVQIGNVQVDIT